MFKEIIESTMWLTITRWTRLALRGDKHPFWKSLCLKNQTKFNSFVNEKELIE